MLIDGMPTAFVDLETTGASTRGNGITEIAIVCVDADGGVDEWTSLVNPGREIPLTISALTGIHDDMVADAPPFEDLAGEIRARLSGHLFVAHNVRFDYGFLQKAFASLSLPFRARKLCTVQLSRQLYPEERQHNLDALMQRHALTCEPRHRALTDARALHEWCRKVASALGEDVLRNAATEQLEGPPLPTGVTRKTIKALPEGPGIYCMYGDDDALLYVGKSVNVRGRVLAHFGAASRDPRERRLFDQTTDVRATPTAGELGALLLEVQTIKAREPVYNRRLRHRAGVHTLTLEPVDDYLVPRITEVNAEEAPDGSYGLYRQVSAAKRALNALADDHRLCRKRL
ncbi:MAG: exonuclease domain-containing protein, partial [Pseudomonadota bacterium]